MRARADRRAQGLVIVNTGNGKGKTTAALGVLLRSWGRGMRVCMLQFIKARTANFGEEQAARKLGVELIPLGDGFTWTSQDITRDRALAQEGWALCREKIASGEYDIVILDEITYCFTFGWLELDDVLAVLRALDVHLTADLATDLPPARPAPQRPSSRQRPAVTTPGTAAHATPAAQTRPADDFDLDAHIASFRDQGSR